MDIPLNNETEPLGGTNQASRPPKPETYGPTATIPKLAAQAGSPLCEVCQATPDLISQPGRPPA